MTITRHLYNWIRPLLPQRWRSPWASNTHPPTIEFVSATRLTEKEFWAASFLGRSIKRLLIDSRITLQITFENKAGLSSIYNDAINRSKSDILVFLHDDVWLEDPALLKKISTGLKKFDVIGVAGNKRIIKNQPSWFFSEYKNDQFTRDDLNNLSGSIYHGAPGRASLSTFGASPATCRLMDGVFLAANRKTLKRSRVQFDPAFTFDFYDLDFCRQACQQNLKIGTWPIKIIHKSSGEFGKPSWKHGLDLYLRKWGQ